MCILDIIGEKNMSVQYIVDDTGKKTGVFLSLDEYEKFLKIKEEFEDIKDFDERIKSGDWEDFDDVKRQLSV